MLLALCWMAMLSAFGQTNWRLDQVHCHEVGAQLQFVTPIQATGGGLVVELAKTVVEVPSLNVWSRLKIINVPPKISVVPCLQGDEVEALNENEDQSIEV